MPLDRQTLENTQGYLDLTLGELRTLVAFVARIDRVRRGQPKYLEIGVWGGGTIKTLLGFTTAMSFMGIDLFEDFQMAADNTHGSGTFRCADVQAFLGARAHMLKGNSAEILPTLTDTFDFIFIEGNHTFEATLKDFELAQSLVSPDGFIAFHNASAHLDPDFSYVTRDGGPWAVTEQVKLNAQWRLVADVERLRVFARVN